MTNQWTQEEIDVLYNYYPILAVDDVVKMLPNRNRKTILMKACELGIRNVNNNTFTKEDDDYIITHYRDFTDEEIAKILNRNRAAICDRRLRLGLHKLTGKSYESVYKYIRAHNTEWKLQSMKACGYKCIITGQRFDEIHHLYNFHKIFKITMDNLGYISNDVGDYSLEELQQILVAFCVEQAKYPLGVCLTKNIHQRFHKIYGNKDNTIEQWTEFYNQYKQNQ